MQRREALAAIISGLALPAAAWGRKSVAAAERLVITRARIDAALGAMVDGKRAVGVSALVWKGGREVYWGAAGDADREARRPMRRDTVVQIYSMTKPVTGTALMKLWEQGRFGLDDPLARHLPAFGAVKVFGGRGPDGKPILRAPARPITVRDAMRHTAGFSYGMGETEVDAMFRTADPLALTNSLQEMGARLVGVPLLFDPGAEWSYSIGVDVQALLVEHLSGEPFEQHVRRAILDPLGMRDTGWNQPQERLPRFAATYVKQADGSLTRQPDEETRALNFDSKRRLTMGGAGLASTIDDYMRFARMLLGKGTLEGTRILAPSTVKLMATDHIDPRITRRHFLPEKGSVGFGLNLAVRTGQPRTAAENRGAVGEFFWDGAQSTLFWVDPANDMAVVFFVQVIPYDGTLHHDIRRAVYGPGYLGPPGD